MYFDPFSLIVESVISAITAAINNFADIMQQRFDLKLDLSLIHLGFPFGHYA